eukprot:TRINITY_DN3318_c0_g1_i15.p1 TRINITY_DN3318_c0_g1~~TRINITY_DN3318_c0_g1_i15.p1  ORF type:complete len:256 (-),score=30.03 TRINITY_DN3318_c0_g1_i15:153-920(-)
MKAPSVAGSLVERTFKEFFAISSQQIGRPDSSKSISDTEIDEQSKQFAVGTSDGQCVLFDLPSGSVNWDFNVLDDEIFAKIEQSLDHSIPLRINSIKIRPRSDRLYLGLAAGYIQVWDLTNKKCLLPLRVDDSDFLSPVNALSFDKFGSWMVSAHNEYILKWHVETGTLAAAVLIDRPCFASSLDPDQIISLHEEQRLNVWSQELVHLTSSEISSPVGYSIIGVADKAQKIHVISGSTTFVDIFHNNKKLYSLTV